ncbi:MAG: arylamine N-acetyltransferase [Bacteroidota bacterium]
MDVQRYLSRIKFEGPLSPDLATLKKLHRQHLLHVPFEDLDIHFKRPFDLRQENIFNKVMNNNRGGFCYEVNSLFNELLKEIGFKTKIISGKVIKDTGEPGPEYDHMAIIVELDKHYIADVGFGDLFIEPLELREGIQFDGRHYFIIEKSSDEFVICMSASTHSFENKYTFTTTEVSVSSFEEPCRDKQVNPDSHFVKNTMCTKITDTGRITIYNDKFIETIGDKKTQHTIADDVEMRDLLKKRFDIEI